MSPRDPAAAAAARLEPPVKPISWASCWRPSAEDAGRAASLCDSQRPLIKRGQKLRQRRRFYNKTDKPAGHLRAAVGPAWLAVASLCSNCDSNFASSAWPEFIHMTNKLATCSAAQRRAAPACATSDAQWRPKLSRGGCATRSARSLQLAARSRVKSNQSAKANELQRDGSFGCIRCDLRNTKTRPAKLIIVAGAPSRNGCARPGVTSRAPTTAEALRAMPIGAIGSK